MTLLTFDEAIEENINSLNIMRELYKNQEKVKDTSNLTMLRELEEKDFFKYFNNNTTVLLNSNGKTYIHIMHTNTMTIEELEHFIDVIKDCLISKGWDVNNIFKVGYHTTEIAGDPVYVITVQQVYKDDLLNEESSDEESE